MKGEPVTCFLCKGARVIVGYKCSVCKGTGLQFPPGTTIKEKREYFINRGAAAAAKHRASSGVDDFLTGLGLF